MQIQVWLIVLALAVAVAVAHRRPVKRHHKAAPQLKSQVLLSTLGFPAGLGFCSASEFFTTDLSTNVVFRLNIVNSSYIEKTQYYKFSQPSVIPNSGILGVACDPDYKTTKTIYVYFSGYNHTASATLSNVLFKLAPNVKGNVIATSIFVSNTPSGYVNGGHVAFGPDGLLYLTIGEITGQYSQVITSNSGKILRLNKDGSIPASNPWGSKNANYAYGLRDSFGFTWDKNGTLWRAEDGPACNDEVNFILPGKNYGWGPKSAALNGNEGKQCVGTAPQNTNMDGSDIQLPNWYWPADIKQSTAGLHGLRPPALTGIAYCDGCSTTIPSLSGKALVGGVNSGTLQVVPIDQVPVHSTVVSKPDVVYHGAPILTVTAAPDKRIYITDLTGALTVVW